MKQGWRYSAFHICYSLFLGCQGSRRTAPVAGTPARRGGPEPIIAPPPPFGSKKTAKMPLLADSPFAALPRVREAEYHP